MTEERPFLEAIKAAPHDTAARLVYADWLEERSDPRAELIRIEEEMRPLPVFSDRFWQLKPRRHELLQSVPKDWLETISYGTDCPMTFAHRPRDWKQWWRLMRVLAEHWFKTRRPGLLADVGQRLEEIDATEARLGRKLPPSLREWMAFGHDVWPESFQMLRRLDHLENESAILLGFLGNRGSQWAIRHQDLDKDDPLLFEFERQKGYSGGHQNLPSNELELFLRHCRGPGGGFMAVIQEHHALVREIRRDFPVHLQLGNPLQPLCSNGCLDIFEKDNLLLSLGLYPEREFLQVEVFKRLPRKAIPGYLWDLLTDGVSRRHGMFI